jgi:hypothetical protein
VRSCSSAIDRATVTTGDSEITGKIRYAGPVLTAWNNNICPPAPRRPIRAPYKTDRPSCCRRHPTRRNANSAGGIIVSAHTA